MPKPQIPEKLDPQVGELLALFADHKISRRELDRRVKRLPADKQKVVRHAFSQQLNRQKVRLATALKAIREMKVQLIASITAGILGEEDADEIARVLLLRTHDQHTVPEPDADRRVSILTEIVQIEPSWRQIAGKRMMRTKAVKLAGEPARSARPRASPSEPPGT